jgi:hypothetical protein
MVSAITAGDGRWSVGYTAITYFMALAPTSGHAIMATRQVTGRGGLPLDFEGRSGMNIVQGSCGCRVCLWHFHVDARVFARAKLIESANYRRFMQFGR